MDSYVCTRISLKPKNCPNPLFYKWLMEWKKEAEEKGSDMRYIYSKALKSLKKYPLVLKSGRECAILQHFGVKLCSMLDKRLAAYANSRQHGLLLENSTNPENVRAVMPTEATSKRALPRRIKHISKKMTEEVAVLVPGSFQIRLFVDCGEIYGSKGRSGMSKGSHKDVFLNKLSAAGVPFEVRKLSVGDFAWACIPDSIISSDTAAAKVDDKILMLPYVIERKRVDDLGSSIRDGRFHEQKFRLKKSGMWQIIYLIEGISEKLGVTDKESSRGLHLPVSTLQQASVNTEVVDRFIVKDTSGQKETAEYLALMTRSLTQLFQGKKLVECEKNKVPEFCVTDDFHELISLSEFNRSSMKCKELTVSQMFIRHLLQIRGLSVEKAQAIILRYPSPSDLCKAYEEQHHSRHLLLSRVPFGPNKRLIGPTLSKAVSDLYTNEVIT